MATFRYLTDNIIEAFDLLGKNHRNLPLGGLVSSVIEFLGRCLVSPKSQSPRNFYKFIDEFLAPINPQYANYKKLLYKDLRCGSAHTIMTKGGVTLSYHPDAKDLHLQIKKRLSDGSFQLWLYSPQLIEDIKKSIMDFVQKAKTTPKLEQDYMDTIKELKKEGQKHIRDCVPKSDLLNAETIDAKGDIIP